MNPHTLDRPLNFAHRGASHEAPENTLAAFERAAELRADGAELDVQISRDGELVVVHDFDLDKTTDGSGLVSTKTLAELQDLDAGSWFSPKFRGQRIPTLQHVIDTVGPRLLLNVELKTENYRDDGLAAAVATVLERNNLVAKTIVSSFNPFALWRARKRNPAIQLGLLYSDDMSFLLRRPRLRHWLRPQALHPHYSLVDGDYVQWATRKGYRTHTWTVDEPKDMRRIIAAGVDIIITNRPDLLGSELQVGSGR
jgi:glycerophosphoryl diester phosphodiesterase